MYPTKMEANGRIYPINTDYKVGLACFRALYDEEITDLQRFYAIETLLLGENVDERDEMILKDKIIRYLKCGNEEDISNDEIDFDYLQDERIVRTSIRQCYHIDLEKTSNLLTRFGGHKMAVGVEIEASKFAEFKQKISAEISKQTTFKAFVTKEKYDIKIDENDISKEF